MLDVGRVRRDFPILEATGVIYLDSAASSLTPRRVVDAMVRYYMEYRANVERGLYWFSQLASEAYEEARKAAARFIGARSPSEIVFVKNATEGINLVAHSFPFRRGDRVVTTLLEHHSNLLPWFRCRERYGVEVETVKPSVEGFLDPADFERAVDDRTRLVAVTHVSNVLGVISPVREIAEIAHEHGAFLLVDGAQSAPHMKIDVGRLGCDFFAFSGHKMCGPTGSGVLYMREEASRKLKPAFLGGGTVEYVGLDDYRLADGPERFEAGTPLIAEVIGLHEAFRFLEGVGLGLVEHHERMLSRRIYEGLRELPNVEVYGPEPRFKLGVTSFNVGGLPPHHVALALDSASRIAVRSGMHCAQPLVREILGKPHGTVRASTYLYNTVGEVERFLAAVEGLARSASV